MPDAPSPDAGSLSARAQEILRRADARLAALREGGPDPDPAAPPDPPPPGATEAPVAEGPLPDLGALLDTIQAGVGAARAHLVALSASLERVAEEIGSQAGALGGGGAPPAAEAPAAEAPAAEAPAAEAPEAEPAPSPPEEPPAPAAPAGERVSGAAQDAARLVAIEMAVAGETREGVGRRLREEFGIRDPRPILDYAFGPERPGPGRAYGS